MRTRIIFFLLLSTFITNTAGAQSIKDLGKAVNKVSGYFKDFDITGTWIYEGVDVEFESDNFLKKAGGKVATAKIENEIDSQLRQVGFTPGLTVFTFDGDGNFTQATSGKTIKGTYEFDRDAGTINLKYLGHLPLKSSIKTSSSSISLLFKADSFLSMVTFIGGSSGIRIIKSMSSILKSYDGMLVGIRLMKQ